MDRFIVIWHFSRGWQATLTEKGYFCKFDSFTQKSVNNQQVQKELRKEMSLNDNNSPFNSEISTSGEAQ